MLPEMKLLGYSEHIPFILVSIIISFSEYSSPERLCLFTYLAAVHKGSSFPTS